MKKFAKSSYSMYLKKLKTLYPDNTSVRTTLGLYDRLTHREFKMVLPLAPKQNVAMKGSDVKPSKSLPKSNNSSKLIFIHTWFKLKNMIASSL